jgi:dipeptidyl aminopeptidase/acylaminoacyl peptidase
VRIAYLKNGDVWFWEGGYKPFQLTFFGDVTKLAISDDGSQIAFARELDYSHHELWVTNTDGSGQQLLINWGQFQELAYSDEYLTAAPFHLDWLPDKDIIAFTTISLFDGPGSHRPDDLYLVNVGSGALTSLLESGKGGDFYFSNDGNKIGLAQPDAIMAVNIDGSEWIELISFPKVFLLNERYYYPELVWSKDNGGIFAVIGSQDDQEIYNTDSTAWYLRLDPTEYAPPFSFTSVPISSGKAHFSPDGQRLAYLLSDSASDPPGFVILKISPRFAVEGVEYDRGRIFFSAWSPDSHQFIYHKDDQPYLGEVDSQPSSLPIKDMLWYVQFVDTSSFLYQLRGIDREELWLGFVDGGQVLIDSGSDDPMRYDFILLDNED